jgi:hypothetical protein
MTPTIALGRIPPLQPELEAIASDLLQGLQYSFVSAAAHPEIRLPFDSLEEAFQGAIGLRSPEQRWTYHSRARRIAMAPAQVRRSRFGRYGQFGAEEFACGGLAIAYRHLPLQEPVIRRRRQFLRLSSPARPPAPPAPDRPSRTTLTLYITDVSCLDRNPEATEGEEIAVGGLALDARGEVASVGRFLVRDDFENGVRKEYGAPGRKFCEFRVPETLGDEPLTYGAAAFLEVADRAGFCEALAGAWAKASPILREAVERRVVGAEATAVSRAAGYVVEQFVGWLREEFDEDVFPPGLAFAGLDAALAASGGAVRGQFTFANQRGRYRVGAQWRVSHGGR